MATNNAINLAGPTPAFFVYPSTASYTPAASPLIFDAISYDTTSNYNSSTGIYTIPTTGIYSINVNLYIGVSISVVQALLVISDGTNNWGLYESGLGVISDAYGYATAGGSIQLSCTQGTNLHIELQSYPGSLALKGSVTGYILTYWCGYMIAQV